ncbi:hypothetical protein [Streptomyces sp. JJ36]|uniref:hypothetical protein n=1 Tax=Streptomyces sp. JJ36 TaxID=2736645 RepID=UPI001F45EB60|nr:hypothetical protein [Streptomyces sp. JJ36]MCF6522278.1 hypothetical protein [Streptomyces sp. JJ36]
MSTAYVPQQPQSSGQVAAGAPVSPAHASEATRLLCAGTYLDAGYRDRVIEELHLNEQRIVAPSLGYDAARVLAHALRARRQEIAWAAALLGMWLVGSGLTGGLLALFFGAAVQLSVASWVRGSAARPPVWRRVPAFLLRWWGRVYFAVLLAGTVAAAFGEGRDASSGDSAVTGLLLGPVRALAAEIEPWQAWAAFVMFGLIALCVAGRRGQFARSLDAELSPQRFPHAAGDPAEAAGGARFQRLKDRIRTEQHAPLIMYHEARPFCGAGAAYETWVLTVELRPDSDKKQQPLSNRAVLEKIRPLLERLRLPAELAGGAVRDRLRWLEIDECVFLPAEGLRRREDAPYHSQAFEEHRARAVEEGAEKRRHFLRVRVGGWEEELVVTVFVRIHTQGRMLMLEVAPHVLLPVREDFKDADRKAHWFRHNNALGKTAWAVARIPRSAGSALAVLGRAAMYCWRAATGGHAGALPDGPELSLRELGSAVAGSQFQEMDASRYLKTIQDRIANGVRAALAESGYQTGEFVQKVVNVSQGAVHIDRVEGSTFAVGSHASASTVSGATEPQKGTDTDVDA